MNDSKKDVTSSGLELQHTFAEHEDLISNIAWSLDGQLLASSSKDRNIRLWNIETGELHSILRGTGRSGAVSSLAWSPDAQTIIAGSNTKTVRIWNIKNGKSNSRPGHSGSVNSVAFSPDGSMFASGSSDRTIRICRVDDGKLRWTLKGHAGEVLCLAWSSNGQMIASSSSDKTIKVWDLETGELFKTFHGHTDEVLSVTWLPDGQTLASGARDCTVRIWSLKKKRRNILEGHTDAITSVSSSYDGRLLASKSNDGVVKLWCCDTWEVVKDINEPSPQGWCAGLAFHPKEPILATLGDEDTSIRVWRLDVDALLSANSETESTKYTNAKIVLLGDTGVGKSGLRLVLTGQPFTATDSTHGRYVQAFHSEAIELNNRQKEIRELLLWDLAGQPSYRLIHQLHLSEVAVALVVVDARSELDPFAGVHHWNRALNHAQTIQGDSALPLKKFLVAARTDRGGIGVSRERIDRLVRDLGFDGYFETSAKEGRGISELSEAIRSAVAWDAMPEVTSTDLFQRTKSFLLAEKQVGRLLSTVDDLYRTFLRAEDLVETEKLKAQFRTCIKLVEARGLLRQLSFGNLVLLQPELIDAYASALVNAAKDEPEGLGSISEEDARSGNFTMSEDERIRDKEQEKLLLIATVEDLLRHEIALREQADLVFPSQFTREWPDSSDPEGKAVTFTFEGPVQNIYSKLIVRLSRSEFFSKRDMWKNAVLFSAKIGGTCGILMNQLEDGRAEITLFFDTRASEETRFQFEEYISNYLQRQALAEGLYRRRIFVCSDPSCGEAITDRQAKKRRELGHKSINCPVCGTEISLLDREERLTVNLSSATSEIDDLGDTSNEAGQTSSAISEIDRIADVRREQETANIILQGKIATADFDVFLAHNSKDKAQVKAIAEALRQRGLNPWLDEERIPPGQWFQDVIQQTISQVKSAAIIIGPKGIGKWQSIELKSFIAQCVEADLPVIPVLLPKVKAIPQNLLFLKELNCVHFEDSIDDPDVIDQLEWGITGKHPRRLLT